VTRRIWKAALLVAAGAAGAGAAIAVASVPGSDGVISACYPITTNAAGHTVPAVPLPGVPAPHLRVIDTSAGQTCNTVNAAGGPPAEATIDWKQTGVPGLRGARGPAGHSATISGANVVTISGGGVITVAGSHGLTINTPSIKPGALPIGTLSLDGGAAPIKFDVFSESVAGTVSTGAGGGQVHELVITKHIDSSSPKLSKACASGEHFPRAVLTIRKAGGARDPIFLNVSISSFSMSSGGDRPTESLTLSFTKIS
jgi:hypothetical protein